MAKLDAARLAQLLVKDCGPTFAKEAGINVKSSPSSLFQLLVFSLLSSARIKSSIAREATKALFKEGLTTPKKMCDAGWEKRTKILNRSGYARYDERTSTMLGQTSEKLIEEYNGDLRKLRDAAGHDPIEERRRLKSFKGMGETGVDIFLREAQSVWDENYPFVDKRAKDALKAVGLPTSEDRITRLAKNKDELPILLDAALRAKLEGDPKVIRRRAQER